MSQKNHTCEAVANWHSLFARCFSLLRYQHEIACRKKWWRTSAHQAFIQSPVDEIIAFRLFYSSRISTIERWPAK